jgi:hypothetical protein
MNQRELLPPSLPVPKVVRLQLTPEQADQLAPLTIKAGRERKNVLFVASTVPFWSPQDSETVWELQVVKVQATLGYKIAKLVRDSLQTSHP